jgi:SAM-dependent methyltransferase/uncharacterized protein YbaR (Trm112 family)
LKGDAHAIMNVDIQPVGWIGLLKCPYCADPLVFTETARPESGRAEFGLLRCRCSIFPVLDGVPIIQKTRVGMFEHTQGTTEIDGVSIQRLVELIAAGASETALLECLSVPPNLAGRLQGLVGWRLSHQRLVSEFARAIGRRRFAAKVLRSRDSLFACDLLEFYYFNGGPLHPAMGHYFIRRFGQPRHLAALALAATLPAGGKPVLDIACGIGHFEHYLTCRADPVQVVGIDINFYHLWIARHWMAPAARFICANANDGLPFVDRAFSATICSDAYHYLTNRDAMLVEVKRCAPNGMVILTRVGNRAVMPNEGNERTLAGYLEEFGAASVRSFDEGELVDHYLRSTDPLTAPTLPQQRLESSKWLSFVWNVPDGGLRSRRHDTIAPHAVGTLGFNPIYLRTPRADGGIQLRFEFPNAWYAFENHGMLAYHPRRVTLTGQEAKGISGRNGGATVDSLLASFVLLGLPERFGRDLLQVAPSPSPSQP